MSLRRAEGGAAAAPAREVEAAWMIAVVYPGYFAAHVLILHMIKGVIMGYTPRQKGLHKKELCSAWVTEFSFAYEDDGPSAYTPRCRRSCTS
jgi:hypothetical protein